MRDEAKNSWQVEWVIEVNKNHHGWNQIGARAGTWWVILVNGWKD